MDSYLLGGLLRFIEALIAASPTILVGLIIAGVFRRLLGHEGTRKLFGEGTWRAIPQAWLLGMLLPVCSLGVIPIVREMRQAGVRGGALLAFGLTAPLFNPISVLYGLTLSDPVVVITFCFCSLLIVTLVGVAWDKLFATVREENDEPTKIDAGWRRLVSLFFYSSRESTGVSTFYIVIGLVGVAILSLILPIGYLQSSAEADDPWAPAVMTGVAVPAFVTPMSAMVQIAAMFQHGNSVGAAFAMLTLGTGVNIGLFAWMVRSYGIMRSASWVVILVVLVLGLAYGVDQPLRPQGVEPPGHTHAFDSICHPFHKTESHPWQAMTQKLNESIAVHEIASLILLGLLVMTGLTAKLIDSKNRLDLALSAFRASETTTQWDVTLSPRVLGVVALIGLVVLSVAGCFLYYPPPEQAFAELKQINVWVFSAGLSSNWGEAEYWIPIYDDWTRKLEVGLALRGHSQSKEQEAAAMQLRESLEELEHAVEDQDQKESQRLVREVDRHYKKLRDLYAHIETAK